MRWTTVLIDHPWLAVLAAVLLAIMWRSTRARLALVVAALWLAYAGWEVAVSEDRPDANIRIDLLVIYPVLAVLTAVAVWSCCRTWYSRASRN